ncbi:MAG TPA: pilus assembly protein TadG-related protein [Gaiellaceae bacterium]|jgi:hypothetical protein
MNKRLFLSARSERAQSLVVTLLFMSALLGMAAAVLDVGSWYRADRKLQANADAAALAGAHELPEDTTTAGIAAMDYANRNDGGLAPGGIKFRRTAVDHDTIEILAERPAPGFFSKLFGLQSVQVRAKAVARAGAPSKARWAAPIGVDEKHPLLQCTPLPCFGQDTTLDLTKTGPGAFRLINIDASRGGVGPTTVADWIRHGFDGYMPLNWYFSDPGAKFNSSQVKAALDERLGTEMLFPVYSNTRGGGANFEYLVIGWVGFRMDSYEAKGSSGKLHGQFTRVIWEGIMNESASPDDFGVRTVGLIE